MRIPWTRSPINSKNNHDKFRNGDPKLIKWLTGTPVVRIHSEGLGHRPNGPIFVQSPVWPKFLGYNRVSGKEPFREVSVHREPSLPKIFSFTGDIMIRGEYDEPINDIESRYTSKRWKRGI